MGISRKTAKDRILSLGPHIEGHLAKMRAQPFSIDYNHWQREVNAAIRRVERLSRHLGERTRIEVMAHVAKWKAASDCADDD